MKIKAKINDVVVANRIVKEMKEAGLTVEQMLDAIKLAKKMYNETNNRTTVN